MTKHLLTKVCICVFVCVFTGDAFGQEVPGENIDIEGNRLAQTGLKFLSISIDPRSAAMGDAVTALEGGAVSMLYNPAGMAYTDHAVDISLGRVQWIADFSYNAGSVAFQPFGGNQGVFGVSVVAADYGEALETIRFDNEQGYLDLGTIKPSAVAVGIGYARQITDRFAVGGHVKYARQSLGAITVSYDEGAPTKRDFVGSPLVVDFGVLYRTGFRSLNFAVSARNFSQEITYAQESFELPLTFNIGLSMDLMDLTQVNPEAHSFVLSVDGVHPRDFSEQIKVGGEYRFIEILSLRGGYIYPTDEQGINFGAGLHSSVGGVDFSADYTYTQFGIFGNVNRIGLGFGF
jgi:hypothetical protein